jgi:hypothetical protein
MHCVAVPEISQCTVLATRNKRVQVDRVEVRSRKFWKDGFEEI